MIYFIQDAVSTHIKIGHSANPWKRLAKMQSDNPGNLTLLAVVTGGASDEMSLHARFAQLRLRGEWFRASDDLLAHIHSFGGGIPRPVSVGQWGESALTSADVARLAGVSTSMLSRIRNGKTDPALSTALRLAAVTGLPIEAFAKSSRAA